MVGILFILVSLQQESRGHFPAQYRQTNVIPRFELRYRIHNRQIWHQPVRRFIYNPSIMQISIYHTSE